MRWVTVLLSIGLTGNAAADLQNVIVNGTFGTASSAHRMAVIADLTVLPVAESYKDAPPAALLSDGILGDEARISEVASGGRAMRALVVYWAEDRSGGPPLLVKVTIPTPAEPPSFAECARVVLLFHVGLPERAAETDFVIYVDEDVVFAESVSKPGWQARAVNLTGWAGESVRLRFLTSARGHWAAFGLPRIVDLWGPRQCYPGGLAGTQGGGTWLSKGYPDEPGLLLVKVDCHRDAEVRLDAENEPNHYCSEKTGTVYKVSPGTHWIPLYFEKPSGYFGFLVESGAAHVRHVDLVPLPDGFVLP